MEWVDEILFDRICLTKHNHCCLTISLTKTLSNAVQIRMHEIRWKNNIYSEGCETFNSHFYSSNIYRSTATLFINYIWRTLALLLLGKYLGAYCTLSQLHKLKHNFQKCFCVDNKWEHTENCAKSLRKQTFRPYLSLKIFSWEQTGL